MTQKRLASLARVKRALKGAKPTADSRLDFSDILESTDAELQRARRVGRNKTNRSKLRES
jgi:two-component sensor histidine kinase